MRRTLADAILKAYEEHGLPNLPTDFPLPDSYPVQLLVRFRLGDLRSLKRGIDEIDRMTPALECHQEK